MEKIKCEICKEEFIGKTLDECLLKLRKHIRYSHSKYSKENQITQENYFKKYLSHLKENSCVYCGKEKRFYGIIFNSCKKYHYGYLDFCSNSCNTKYNVENGSFDFSERQKKIERTKLIKYGDPNYNNRQKYEETSFDIYGEKNPTINKEISMKISSGWHSKPESERFRTIEKRCITKIKKGIDTPRHIRSYRDEWERQVDLETERSYRKYKHIINPLDLPRELSAYHLDHRYTKHEGFLNNIDPKVIGNYNNLQMLWWEDNLSKSTNCDITLDELEYLIEKDGKILL